nr:hypothetical protein [Tanacetum cinerariifolium]
MDITPTLSPITPLDIQFNTPSPSTPSPPLFGHHIPWNLLEAHGATCLWVMSMGSLSYVGGGGGTLEGGEIGKFKYPMAEEDVEEVGDLSLKQWRMMK